jgi:hypothetical protein
MERQQVVENITLMLQQAKSIATDRKYGYGITYVYYSGGTLCLDINDKSNKKFLIMVNISTEKYMIEKENGEFLSFLLPLKALRLAFDIYEIKKGKTEYFETCLKNSCLRFLNEKNK